MFRSRTRLKPIGQAVICQRCGRQRRAASTGRAFWDIKLEESGPNQQPPLASPRDNWSDRAHSSTASHLHSEPRLNDLRPRSQRPSIPAVASSSRHDHVPPALSRSYTHLLRRLLDLHSWEDPHSPETPQSYLFRHFRLPQPTLSRQDTHTIIHACIRNGRPMVAARFLDELLAQNLADLPQTKTRVARRTLAYLFKACAYEIESQRQDLVREEQTWRRRAFESSPTSSPVKEIREFILEPRRHSTSSRPSSLKPADRSSLSSSTLAQPDLDLGGERSSASLPPQSIRDAESASNSPNFSLLTSDNPPASGPLASLNFLIALFRRLQDLRNPRPMAVYKYLIAAAVSLKRPDIAAGVYVGMVEDWIMEGRLALGAQMDQFHPGGGPPEEGRAELELASDLLKSWWKGIRSWSLPGEVLSPHARIDLWHPRKTSPNDRLRHFPLPNPTSPPSLVPAPDEELLNMIIVSLHLDPMTRLEEFAASMRACATLANTIHSRTLPYMSKASLITVLGQVPYLPKVYPEDVDPDAIARRDEWAYTAYTHVHLALQSLLWTPTTRVETVEAGAADVREKRVVLGSNIYAMAPLSIPACQALMKYGFRKLQSISAAVPTFRYLSTNFAPRNLTGVLASMFHAAITSRNENIMVQSKRMVFAAEESRKLDLEEDSVSEGETQRDLPPHLADSPEAVLLMTPEVNEDMDSELDMEDTADPAMSFVVSDTKVDDFVSSAVNSQVRVGSEDSIDERDESQLRFMALFRYYVWMDKPRMIEKLVYELLPHVDQPGGYRPDPLHADLRPPTALRPRTYKMMLWSLRMTRQTALAQKVFHQALLADAYWKKRYGTNGHMRDSHRTLIHSYAIMINVWKDICHYSPKPNERSETGESLRPNPGPLNGFSVLPHFDTEYKDSPYRQGLAMILHIYALAREAWLEAAWDPVKQDLIPDRARGIAPDTIFLNTVADALAPRWGVNMKIYKICDFRGRPVEPLKSDVLEELRSFIDDMEMFEVPVPSLLRIRAMDPEDAVLHPWYPRTKPGGRTVRVMNFLRHYRQEQDKSGRIHIGKDRIEKRWDEREPAADLWWWQARGGGRLPRGSMRRASYRWSAEQDENGTQDRGRKRMVGTWVVEKDEQAKSVLARKTLAERSHLSPPFTAADIERKTVQEGHDIRAYEEGASQHSKARGASEEAAEPFSFKPSYS